MEVKKSYVIALNDEGIMEKIIPKQNMKIGQKVFYFEDDIIKTNTNKVHRYNNFMKTIGSIAALFLIVFTFFHTMKSETAYAVVSLDINPSIQIEVDSKQTIIKVEGVNTDAKNIDFSDINDMPLNDGIQKIKEKLVENNYLDTNREVLVAFAFTKNEDNNDYEQDVKDVIQSTFPTEKVTYVKGDKDDIDEAKTKGISLGRYEASLVVDEATKSKIDVAPVKEITASIKDKDNVTQWDAKDEKNADVTPAASTNSEVKTEKPASDKPVINGAADNAVPNVDSGKAVDNNTKTDKGEEVLDLKPEVPVPVQSDKDNVPVTKPADQTTIDVAPIVNNPTSGKIEEGSSKTSVDASKSEENSNNKSAKN
jgi:hypothetical protein